MHSEIRLFFCLRRRCVPKGNCRLPQVSPTEARRDSSENSPPSSRNHSVVCACRIADPRDAANIPNMSKVRTGIFCVNPYSQSYFRKVSLSTGVQFPEPFRQAVSVQERLSRPVCKAHRSTSETLLASSFLNSYYTAVCGEMQYR